MDKNVHDQRLPHLSLVLPLSSTEEDAREAARQVISDRLDISTFEILQVELIQEGMIHTRDGTKEGKRYRVVFRQIYGEVVYIHPDFDAIMRRGW